MNNEEIKQHMLEHGFKTRLQPDGTTDLNQYVYAAAVGLLTQAGVEVTDVPPKAGSVLYAANKPCELLPALCRELWRINLRDAYVVFEWRLGALLYECATGKQRWPDDDHPIWEQVSRPVLTSLINALNEKAPPGHFFGAHPDDTADWGFWPINYRDGFFMIGKGTSAGVEFASETMYPTKADASRGLLESGLSPEIWKVLEVKL